MVKNIIHTDDFGNQLIYKCINKRRTLNIKLKKHTREIGEIIGNRKDNFYLIIKRNREKHLMRVNNSYGFNDIMLKRCINAKILYIYLYDEIGKYKIPISLILDKGTYLTFSEQGFERQIFLSLYEIEKLNI